MCEQKGCVNKKFQTPTRIEPTTLRMLLKRLNKPHHCVPLFFNNMLLILRISTKVLLITYYWMCRLLEWGRYSPRDANNITVFYLRECIFMLSSLII